MRRFLLVASAVLLSGCHDGMTGLQRELLREKFEFAQAKWVAKGIADYSMTVQFICFCPPDESYRITVTGGVISSAVSTVSGTVVEDEFLEGYPSIDILFREIGRAIDARADYLDAEYDRTRGFPRRVAINHDVQALDSGITFIVTEFVAH
jgi:hypothetical protein